MSEGHPRDEVAAAVEAYLDHREQVQRGEADWAGTSEFFTDDAVFIDAAWGRVEGRQAIADMLSEAMQGLDAFRYPTDVVAISGDDVLIAWRQVVPALQLRGDTFQHTGMSMLRYAGDGRFSFEEDLMNVALVGHDLLEAGWEPGPGFRPPPPDVAR